MTDAASSQSHLAYLCLERLIVTLALKPGALVTEKQLIEMAGQGRTPVREAIQKLAWEGLILVRPRIGLRIAEIRPEDRDHIMLIRRRLEPEAAALAARRATDAQRIALVACAQAMTGCAASGDLGAFLGADKNFDEIMERACPNGFVTAALAPVQTHFRRIWYADATLEKMHLSISLHVAVIRAIQNGDEQGAMQAMATLVERVGKVSESPVRQHRGN